MHGQAKLGIMDSYYGFSPYFDERNFVW